MEPNPGGWVGMINIVPEGLHLAPAQVRTLTFKARIKPVLIEGHDLLNAHKVDEVAATLALSAASSDYVVTNPRVLADNGLARR